MKKLEQPLDKILSYKPKSAPKKALKHPSKAELEQVFKFEVGRIIEV